MFSKRVQIDIFHIGVDRVSREQIMHIFFKSRLDKRFIEYVDNGGPVLRFLCKHRSDEISKLLGVSWHNGGIAGLQNFHRQSVIVLRLKGKPEITNFVKDDSQGPDIAA